MDRMREGHKGSPFKQENISSSSLEGMERPVRSFKSFIRTVPPHPTAQKPLPPIPSPKERPSPKQKTLPPASSMPTFTYPTLNSSIDFSKAPSERGNEEADVQAPKLSPPTPESRTSFPLLPEPSTDISGLNMERTSWSDVSAPQSSRLLPIYDRQNGEDFGPPRTPPKFPLPIPSSSKGRAAETVALAEQQNANSSNRLESTGMSDLEIRYRPASPTSSVSTSVASNGSASKKVFATLGIGNSAHQAATPENRAYRPDTAQNCSERRCLQAKKLRTSNKGSLLTDDSWEEEQMNDKMCQFSFPQDYHDLLAGQYQEVNVRAVEMVRPGDSRQSANAQLNAPAQELHRNEAHLVPRPLSWQKGSGQASMPSPSSATSTDGPTRPEQKRSHKKIVSWVPRRLSVGPRRQPPETPCSKSVGDSRPRERTIPEAVVDRVLKDNSPFSSLLPSSRTFRIGRKRKAKPLNETTAAPPHTLSHPQPAVPLLRLGSPAVVRQSPSPAPRSEAASVQERSPASECTLSGSQTRTDYSPQSDLSDHRSSLTSQQSHSPVVPGTASHIKSRNSASSSQSHQSSTSSLPVQKMQRNVQTPPPLPPGSRIPPSHSHTPSMFLDAWTRSKSHKQEEEPRKVSLIQKAKDAKHRHQREARQDRLKKSIRVLGPTDPGVVAGYVRRERRMSKDSETSGRPPGYTVNGPL